VASPRETDEAEFAAGDEHEVGGEAAQVCSRRLISKKQMGLGLAARQLDGGDRLLVSASRAGRGSPRGRWRRGRVARRRAQRVFCRPPSGRLDPTASSRSSAAKPPAQSGTDWAFRLEVGCSRGAASPARGGRDVESRRDGAGSSGERRDLVAQVEAEGGDHLVVARTAGVEPGAGGADPRRPPASRSV